MLEVIVVLAVFAALYWWYRRSEAAAARNGSFQEVVVELVAGGRARLHSLDPAGASLLANVNTPSDFARLAAPAAG